MGSHSIPGEPPTKEFFIPATATINGELRETSNFSVIRLDAANEYAVIDFYVPSDFTSIVAAVIIVIPGTTQAAADWDINSGYAASGQAKTTHTESDAATTYNTVADQMYEVDISGILSVLAAGDYVGVRLRQVNAAHPVDVLGIRFQYS